MNKHKRTSKFLTMILRHKPEKIGVELDQHGWCDIENLISKMQSKNSQFSRKILDEIVEYESNKVYDISSDGMSIRAYQEYSTNVNVQLEEERQKHFIAAFLKNIWNQLIKTVY